jgi:LPS export ABC transporter protein LptC
MSFAGVVRDALDDPPPFARGRDAARGRAGARPGRAPLRVARAARLAVAACLVLASSLPASAESPPLRLEGMTFVGSRGSVNELVLRATRATFQPDRDVAELEDVRATVDSEKQSQSFVMTCERGELNVETNDFEARGDVRGVTADGQRYSTPWVRYQHEAGVLYTEAPVVMVDDTGTFRGDGFRYYVREGRFQLLGNVSVVQSP